MSDFDFPMTPASVPYYLLPYENAARQHGGGFGSLLWAGEQTQTARFAAMVDLCRLDGKSLLDVGCGRADLLDYLDMRGIVLHDYIGLEAIDALADVAEDRLAGRAGARLVRGDFVRDPARLFVGADVMLFSGSLNTLDDRAFYSILRRAIDATAESVIFNFLSSSERAASDYLHWREPADVLRFCENIADHVRLREGYLDGDATIYMSRNN